jgi:hypothetical protein
MLGVYVEHVGTRIKPYASSLLVSSCVVHDHLLAACASHVFPCAERDVQNDSRRPPQQSQAGATFAIDCLHRAMLHRATKRASSQILKLGACFSALQAAFDPFQSVLKMRLDLQDDPLYTKPESWIKKCVPFNLIRCCGVLRADGGLLSACAACSMS